MTMIRFSVLSLVVLVLVLTLSVMPSMAKTEIRMVTYGDAFDTYRNIEQAFGKANPDYELIIESYPYAEYVGKLTVMIASGTSPDVFQTWAELKPAWVESDFLMDLTDYWEQSDVAQNADLYPFVLDSAIYNGKIYGVPHDFNPMAWILNTDAFDEAGIPLPDSNWTVEEMGQYAVKLADPERDRYGALLSGHWSILNWQWSVLFTGEGWLNEDRTEVLVDDPRHADMLAFWYDLAISRGVVNSPTVTPARDQWQGGYAMWQGWTGYAFTLADVAPYDWTFATMPKGPAGNLSIAQGHMWSIPSNASDPDKSWVLLEWLLSPEGQEAIVKYDNRQPMSNDPDLWGLYFGTLPSDKQRLMQQFVLETLYGQDLIHTMSFWPAYGQMNEIMNRHLNTVFTGHEPPSNALARAALEMRALLDD